MKNYKPILLILLSIAALMGCDKKNDQGVAVRDSSNANRGYTPQGYVSGAGLYYSAASGTITSAGGNFSSTIRAFLSPPMDPSQIGDVDPNSGVTFSGIVRFDSNGNLVPSSSGIQIQVNDSFATQGLGGISPVGIPGTTGRVTSSNGYSTGYGTSNTSGYADITFEDQYGALEMTGNFDANVYGYFQGNMSYLNKQTGQRMTLGQFRISACGFFVCAQ